MKKTTLLFLFTTLSFLTYSQEVTLFDFGSNTYLTAGNWNNITDATLTGSNVLIDDQGTLTGETLTITDAFDDDPGELGTTSPDGSLPFPSSSTIDFFFGEDQLFDAGTPSNEPTGGFTLTGLEAGKYYSFKIFASRAGVSENRETLYTITGNSGDQTATLNPSGNTSNVAAIYNVQPDINGEIIIDVRKGLNNVNETGFYYLGAIEMTKTDMALSADSFSFNGLVNIYPNPSSKYINISYSLKEAAKVKMSIYNINGKAIKTILNEKKSVGSFIETWDRSNVASGLYILEIDADGRKYNSKIVLE